MERMNETEYELFEELDYRENDGIEVSLLWSRRDNQVNVFVVDTKTDVSFELPVDGHDALHAFHHPYAYAARVGVEIESAAEATSLA